MENMKIWNSVKRPPAMALKTIGAGRLKGKSDINPQWRMQAMTEAFGPCGIGWKYSIEKLWTEPGTDGQFFAFALVNVCVKTVDGWSECIPGIGGHMLIVKESSGLHNNDEAYKMAVTDALSVALKALGVAADIYAGLWDGSQYTTPDVTEPKISKEQLADLETLMVEVKADLNAFVRHFKVGDIDDLTQKQFNEAIVLLEKKRKAS
jgi:hypothetical protein